MGWCWRLGVSFWFATSGWRDSCFRSSVGSSCWNVSIALPPLSSFSGALSTTPFSLVAIHARCGDRRAPVLDGQGWRLKGRWGRGTASSTKRRGVANGPLAHPRFGRGGDVRHKPVPFPARVLAGMLLASTERKRPCWSLGIKGVPSIAWYATSLAT